MSRSLPPQIRERTLAKARTLLEALPFLEEHRGSVVVAKIGGAVMRDGKRTRSFARDLALLQHVGVAPVIVHGGGPQVSSTAGRLGLQTSFIDGHRVTDEATLNVATMVLAGKVNTDLVAALSAGGTRAAGVSGVDGGLVVVRRRSEPDLGFVGEVERVDATLVRALLDRAFVPVVASIAADVNGQPYNVNADVVAAELAVALGASKLVYLSDVPGVIGADGQLLSELGVAETLDLLARGDVVDGGMIPKLESAVRASKGGVARVHLLDGRVEHALVLELLTPEGVGTMIRRDAGDRA